MEEKQLLINPVGSPQPKRNSHGAINDDASGSIQHESALKYRARWKSIWVLYMTMFFSSVEFAIVMSSLWPYLKRVDPKVDTNFIGWTNSGFSLCQMIGSFVFGIWCNYLPAMQPLLFSLLLTIAGSLLYGYADSFPNDGLNMILIARLLLGLSAGNSAVCRTVLSESTTLKERTRAFANLAMWQAVGFAFGPAMQVATIPIGDKGLHIGSLKMNLNIYTAPGFLGFVTAVINIIALAIWFRKFEIDIYEGKKPAEIANGKSVKPDRVAVLVATVMFFVFLSVFALNETIMSPLLMDEFGWTNFQTVFYGGIILAVAGVIAVFCFHIVKWLSLIFTERAIIAGGLLTILIGFIVYLPWGHEYPALEISKIIKHGNKTVKEITPGCPQKFEWCTTQPKLYFPQYITAATLVGIGYPIGFLAVNTLYSKILGPRQQGIYMAWISGVGSFARVIGPLLVTHAYVGIGPRWTFFAVDVIVTFSILLLGCTYHRLVPFHEYLVRISNIKV